MNTASSATASITLEQMEGRWFKRALAVSSAGHLIIFILLVWRPHWMKATSEAVLMQPSVRVDIVDLPDVLLKDLDKIDMSQQKTEDKSAPVPLKKEKETEVEDEKDTLTFKEKQKEEKKRKKILDTLREDLKRRMAVEKLRQTNKGLIIKGNKLSQGTSLTGEQMEGVNAYGGQIYSLVKARWNLPVWLQQKNLHAVVTVWISRTGEVLRTEFTTHSGNEDFDKYALRAIELASPFPPPPEDFASYFSLEGIGLRFPD
jgi:TonB family protein